MRLNRMGSKKILKNTMLRVDGMPNRVLYMPSIFMGEILQLDVFKGDFKARP